MCDRLACLQLHHCRHTVLSYPGLQLAGRPQWHFTAMLSVLVLLLVGLHTHNTRASTGSNHRPQMVCAAPRALVCRLTSDGAGLCVYERVYAKQVGATVAKVVA